MNKTAVLFLGANNSARSLMAEALLRHHAADRFDAFSCGLSATLVHPLTLRALEERKIDASRLRSKDVATYLGRLAPKYAIIVCQPSEKESPTTFPFPAKVLRWPFENPMTVDGTEESQLSRFRRVRDQIEQSILEWIGR